MDLVALWLVKSSQARDQSCVPCRQTLYPLPHQGSPIFIFIFFCILQNVWNHCALRLESEKRNHCYFQVQTCQLTLIPKELVVFIMVLSQSFEGLGLPVLCERSGCLLPPRSWVSKYLIQVLCLEVFGYCHLWLGDNLPLPELLYILLWPDRKKAIICFHCSI